MKVTTVLASFMAAASLNAAVIEQVIVRQQWPWSTDVKVEYKLSGVTSPVDISVKAFNGNVELDSSRLAASMTGDRFGITETVFLIFERFSESLHSGRRGPLPYRRGGGFIRRGGYHPPAVCCGRPMVAPTVVI